METIEELETRLLNLDASASTDSGVGRIEIHRRLAELYEAQGAFASALSHYKQYHRLEKARLAPPLLPRSTPEDFQPPDRRRLAEALRRSRIKTRELYQVSRNLNAAQSEQALLEVLAQPALERGAIRAILVYLTLNNNNNPEWLKIAATVTGGADPQPSPDKTYHPPNLSFRHLWLTTPSRPQLIRDIRHDDRVDEQTRQIYLAWGVQALAILPLMYGGYWVGLILFHWNQPHPFSEDERAIYTTLIGLAAPAVHSRRLLVEQERTLVNKLYQISRGLNTARDKDEMLATFAEPLMEPGKIDRALLGRIETDREGEPCWLEFLAIRSASERLPLPSLRLYLPNYPGTQVWLENPHQPVLVADVNSDPRMSQNGRELMAQANIMSLVIVPLMQSNRWVGVLFFSWFQPHKFSELEVEIFQALPAMVTPAADNLWLMEILERLVAKRTAQLQESEERLREVVEGTNDLVTQLDLEGRFLYLNHTAEKILGQQVKTCLGSPLLEFVYPEDQERTGRLLNDWRSASASHATLENRLVNRQTGQLYSMDWSINLHRDPAGQLTHFSAIGHDITGRKEAEEAIRLVNTELRQRVEELVTLNRITQTLATLTSLPKALEFVARELVNLLDGNGALVGLLDETRSALRIVAHHSQYSGESLVGRIYPLDIYPFSAQVVESGRVVVITDAQNHPTTEADWKVIRSRGIHAIIGLPLLARGEIMGVVSVSSITPDRTFTADEIRLAETVTGQVAGAIANAQLFEEEKRQRLENARLFEAEHAALERAETLYEEAAQARKAAEVANRAKSTFLATMSHEFRTPLNVILGFAQLLRREPGWPEPQQEALSLIQQSGEHLLTLINDVLDLSRIEAGKLQLDILDFHLPAFLRKVSDMIRISAETKGLSFYLVSGALPDFIQADERRLRQILINLLSNAVKFTNEGQVILRVEVHREESGNREPGSLVPIRFEVEDTGVGIASENLKTIFDPFQQSKDYVRKAQGTGLGLSICRNLVELMGGNLQIESKVGQGSLFWFQLSLPEIQIGVMDKLLDLAEANPAVTWETSGGSAISGDDKDQPLAPSSAELANLIELARLGDIAHLRRQAEALKVQNGQLAPFVTELERLLRTFQLDIIQSWLKSYQQAKEDRC